MQKNKHKRGERAIKRCVTAKKINKHGEEARSNVLYRVFLQANIYVQFLSGRHVELWQ